MFDYTVIFFNFLGVTLEIPVGNRGPERSADPPEVSFQEVSLSLEIESNMWDQDLKLFTSNGSPTLHIGDLAYFSNIPEFQPYFLYLFIFHP